MKIIGTTIIGCKLLFSLLAAFILLMLLVYHDCGYMGTEQVVTLSGAAAGTSFCLFRIARN